MISSKSVSNSPGSNAASTSPQSQSQSFREASDDSGLGSQISTGDALTQYYDPFGNILYDAPGADYEMDGPRPMGSYAGQGAAGYETQDMTRVPRIVTGSISTQSMLDQFVTAPPLPVTGPAPTPLIYSQSQQALYPNQTTLHPQTQVHPPLQQHLEPHPGILSASHHGNAQGFAMAHEQNQEEIWRNFILHLGLQNQNA